MAEPKCCKEGCQDTPAYVCDCKSNIYICITHLGPHIMLEPSRHHISNLDTKPNFEAVESVREFLENYAEEASSVKNMILEKSTYKVSKIHATVQKYLKQLSGSFKLANKWLNDLNNLCKIQKDTNDPFYQALLLPGEAAINKIKPLIFTISDNQDILCKLFTEVDIESIVDKQINKKFDIFLKQYHEKTEKICSDKVKDLEISLKKSTDARIKALELENIREINEIKTKFADISCDISQHKRYIQNSNQCCKQKYDEFEKELKQIFEKDAENNKEINEIKANISNFNCDLSFLIDNIGGLDEYCKQKINEIEKKLSEIVESKNKNETLSQKINEIEKELRPKAQRADDKTVSNQAESKTESHESNIFKVNPLMKSQTQPNFLINSPVEKSLVLKGEAALEVDYAANECSNPKHDISSHISGCSENHCSECLINYWTINRWQNNFYCHHGKRLLASDIRNLEEEFERKKNWNLNKLSSARADNFAKRIEKIPQTFDRNAQTPTTKYIPRYESNEKSAIPIRSSDQSMYFTEGNSKFTSPRSISKKQFMSFHEPEKKKG